MFPGKGVYMPKNIIREIDVFSRLLIQIITDATPAGSKKLADILQDAHTHYRIVSYRQNRDADFIRLKDEIQKFPESVTRLQAIFKFINENNWTATSANTSLLMTLITAVPGYYVITTEQLLTEVLNPLLKSLVDFIPIEVARLTVTLTSEETLRIGAEHSKRDQGRLIKQVKSALTVFEDDDSQARKSAREHPEKYCFSLKMLSEKCRVTLFNSAGKGDIFILPQKPDKYALAERAVEFMNQINVLINPARDNPLLINPVSVFILTHTVSCRLEYYDAVGKKTDVGLDQYPFLDACLRQKPFNELSASTLRPYLRHITISREIQDSKHSSVSKVLKKSPGLQDITLIVTNDIKQLPAFRLRPDTWYLTRDADEWQLYLRQKGDNKRMNTSDWVGLKAFNRIMNPLEHVMPEALESAVKTRLVAMIAEIKKESAPVSVSKLDMSSYAELNQFFGSKIADSQPQKIRGDIQINLS